MNWTSDAIGAALIAGLISVVGLMITNQSKVSEFRQKWINELRDDIASVITHGFAIYEWDGKDHKALNKAFSGMHRVTARISLRLNPQEKETTLLLSKMNDMRKVLHTEGAEFEDVNLAAQQLTQAGQTILKKEWTRVKRGEPVYRWTFRIASATTLLTLLLYLVKHHSVFRHLVLPS